MIRIHIFHTGSVKVDVAIPYKERNPLSVTGLFRGEEKKVVLPVSSYLIEYEKGNVLIDSGWHSKYVHEKPHRFFGLLDSISTPLIKEGESIDAKIQNIGLSVKDIDYVFLSHMDFDHTSGLELLKDAKNIMASTEEINDSKKYFFRYVKANWKNVDINSFRYENSGIGPVGKSFDVFDDESIILVNTPGHSHGHFSAIIKNNGKFVVLAGDAIYTARSIRENIIPGFTVDKNVAKLSLSWLSELSREDGCILMAANHDPDVKEQVIEI